MALRILLGLAAACLIIGAGLIYVPAAFLVAGLCLALFAVFFVVEVSP